MNVSLTPELTHMVKEKVASGLYNNASEVIREALRLMHSHEQEKRWLQREAGIGYKQLQAGETVVIESKEDLAAILREEE